MRPSLLLVAAIAGGVILVAMGFVAALRKPDRDEEAQRMKLQDDAMMKASRDDAIEPARFVP